jgi:hypothetical protein
MKFNFAIAFAKAEKFRTYQLVYMLPKSSEARSEQHGADGDKPDDGSSLRQDPAATVVLKTDISRHVQGESSSEASTAPAHPQPT